MQYPACLAHPMGKVCKIGGKWPYNCYFYKVLTFRICSKQQLASLCSSHLAFSPRVSPNGAVIHKYSHGYNLVELPRTFDNNIRGISKNVYQEIIWWQIWWKLIKTFHHFFFFQWCVQTIFRGKWVTLSRFGRVN